MGSHAWTEPNANAVNARESEALSVRERMENCAAMVPGGLILYSCSGVEGWWSVKMEKALSEVNTAKWDELWACQETCKNALHEILYSHVMLAPACVRVLLLREWC